MKPAKLPRMIVLTGLFCAAGCDPGLTSFDEILLKSWPLNEKSPNELGLQFDEVWFETADGSRLFGWHVPATSGAARATVLIHTGMQGNLIDYLPTLPWFAENGFNVLVYDWRGFGNSEGQRRFQHFEEDTNAAVEYLISRSEPSARVIVHFGVSLGAAPALAAAARYPNETVGAVVFGALDPGRLPTDYLVNLISPLLLPLGDISGAVFGALATPYLGPQNHAANVKSPILAVIAEDDVIVPPVTQLALFDQYPEPKQIIYTYGGHINSQNTDPEIGEKIVDWIEQLDGLLPAP